MDTGFRDDFRRTFLLHVAARQVPADPFMAIGWTGMAGFLLTLHFGVFELRANYWQGKGIRVRSIMNSPHRAGTVPAISTEFLQRWGPSPQWRDWPLTPFTRTASSCDYEYDVEQESNVRNSLLVRKSSTNAFVCDMFFHAEPTK